MSDVEARLVDELASLLSLRPSEWVRDDGLSTYIYKHPRAEIVLRTYCGAFDYSVSVMVGGFWISGRRPKKKLINTIYDWDEWHRENGLLDALQKVRGT